MKKLGFAVLAPLTALAAGSSSLSCGGSPDGQFEVSWTIELNGNPATCDQVNAATFQVQIIDSFGVSAPFQYSCDLGLASLPAMQPGSYMLTPELLDNGGQVIQGSILPTFTGVITAGAVTALDSIDFSLTQTPQQGNLSVTWGIEIHGQTGQCSDVGASTFEVVATPSGTQVGNTFDFDCTAGSGNVGPLPPGDYTLAATLLDQNMTVVAGPLSAQETLGNTDVDVPEFDFSL